MLTKTELKSIDLFTELDDALIEDIYTSIKDKTIVRDLPARSSIFEQGQVPEYVVAQITGKSKAVHITEDGSEVVLRNYNQGVMIGLLPVILRQNIYYGSTVTVVKCRLAYIPAKAFVDLLNNQVLFENKLLHYVLHRFSGIVNKGHLLLNKNPLHRIYLYLLDECTEVNNFTHRYDCSQEILAGCLGISRSTLSRTLKCLQKEGIIILDKKQIKVSDVDRLRMLLQTS